MKLGRRICVEEERKPSVFEQEKSSASGNLWTDSSGWPEHRHREATRKAGDVRQGVACTQGCHDANTEERDPSRSSTYLSALKEAKIQKGSTKGHPGKRKPSLTGLKELGLFTQTRGWLLPTYERIRE